VSTASRVRRGGRAHVQNDITYHTLPHIAMTASRKLWRIRGGKEVTESEEVKEVEDLEKSSEVRD